MLTRHQGQDDGSPQSARLAPAFRLALTACLALVCCTFAAALPPQTATAASRPGETALGLGNVAAGVYEVSFRLQIDRKEDTVTPLATLAVSVSGYPNAIQKVITPVSFDAANAVQEFRFLFDNFKAQGVQAAANLSQNKVPAPKLSVEKISIAPVQKPCIGTVWPGKILYRTGEKAAGFVVAYNGTGLSQTVALRCVLESDLNATRSLKEEALTLAAGERREVPLAWKTGKEEYGFALAATLLDASGNVLSQNREYFSVADNLWQVGITQAGRGCTVPSGPGPNESLPVSWAKESETQLATELARPFAPVYWNYTNYVELYGSPDNFFNQAPDKDYWYSGMGEYTMGKRWLQMAIEWLHRRGMRATSYVLPASCGYGGEAVYRQHPEWFAYDKNGQLAVGSYYQKKLEVGSAIGGPETPWKLQLSPYALWLTVNIADLDVIDAFVTQVIKAHEMFGFDGIRFDVAPFLADGYDLSGHKIVPDSPQKKGELEVRAWKRMRDRLWHELGPDFAIGLNTDYDLYHEQYPAAWDECCRKGQLLMEEVPRSCWQPQSPRNRWQDYLIFYRGHGEIIRNLGGHPLIIGFDNQYPVDHLYMNVFTYAMRAHPYAYQYHADSLPLGNYAQFATRYSALLWDIKRVTALPEPEKKIEVKAAAPVWWRELACVRQAPDGRRQYLIHLINPPAQERIYTDAGNKVPAALRDVQVILKPGKGERFSRAWLLTADPVMQALPLPLTVGAGQLAVTVPRLDFWSLVVFE